ncbi:MAG: J domain-containing protein [bacterium]
MKDYYTILEVKKDSSPEEIKKAYRRLAHKYHPDKAGGDEAKFKEINEAYQVLSNVEKRHQYDQFGQTFSGGQTPPGGFGGANAGGWNVHTGGFEDISDLGDIFDAVFGSGARQKRRTYHRGADLELPVSITLKEAQKGKKVDFSFETYVLCTSCKGIGYDESAGTAQCERCDGKGEIRETQSTFFGNFAKVVPCKKCGGNGKIPNKVCSTCKGSGRIRGKRDVQVEIRPGIEDGQIIKMVGMGEIGEKQAGAGDLYVRVSVKSHSLFTRRGNDLLIKLSVSLIDILLQKKIEVPLLNGEHKTIEIPAGYNINESLRIKGEGMTVYNDLVVIFEARTPKKLDKHARALLEDLAKHIKE